MELHFDATADRSILWFFKKIEEHMRVRIATRMQCQRRHDGAGGTQQVLPVTGVNPLGNGPEFVAHVLWCRCEGSSITSAYI
jgi:hypothetical protein